MNIPTIDNTINLTPHDITLIRGEEKITYPKSNATMRITEVDKEVEPCFVRKGYESIQVVGEVEWKKYKYAIVSQMVLSALGSVLNPPKLGFEGMFICPDTGTGCVRDKEGKIIGTKRFVI